MLQPDVTCALEELGQGLGQSFRISDEEIPPWTREAILRPVKKPEAASCVRRGAMRLVLWESATVTGALWEDLQRAPLPEVMGD